VSEAEEAAVAAPINSAAGTISMKKKAVRTDSESDLAAVLAESLKRKQELDLLMTSDPHRLFLLSLLDDFKKIPHERKADVKISMINSIRSASLVQRPAPPPPPPRPPPPHQYRNNYTSHSVYATASSQPLNVDPIHPQNVTISTPSTSRQSANNPISDIDSVCSPTSSDSSTHSNLY